MKPTAEQELAIESDDLDILLEAGAGSGKTSTTVDRYKRLLRRGRQSRDPLEPAEILVFTFTDKAAGELRERIREQRDEMGAEFSMSSLWVGTFHSICARILRAHPIAARVDPAFDVIDDVVASRLKEEAFAAALARTTEDDEAVALLARFSQPTLKTGIQNAYERLRAAGMSEPALPAPPPTRPPELIHAELTSSSRRTLSDPDLKKACAGRITTLLDHLATVPPEELTFARLEEAGFYKSSKEIPELVAEVNRARTELLTGELGPRYWRVLGDLLGNYSTAYSRGKTARGGMDFEDLQLRTLELLRESDPIAATYREQFDEIMVDEFQDTNQLQMDLIEALRGPGTSLFTVGDEMQAIYGFRYADVELFRRRRESPAVTVFSLSANFRSQAPVIGAVNELGSQLERLIEGLRTSDEPGGETGGTRHQFSPLRVGVEPSDGVDPGVEILLTQKEVWQEVDLGPLSPPPGAEQHLTAGRGQHEAEALALAHHIRAATEQGVPPGEIVILFRTRSLMWLFEAALKQVGLKPYVVGGTGFWETREGVDLRSLLATIANPLDDESLIGTLAGPACGLSTSALWLLARRRGPEQPLWPAVQALAPGDPEIGVEDIERAREFVSVVESLRKRQASTPLAELVHDAVAETGYDLVNLMRDPSAAGLANLSRVAEIAAEFESTEGRDLRGLIAWIDESAQLDAEQAVATEDEDSDVVRLMTIHKSKGLEFPMVCVADLGRDSKSNSESVFWIAPRSDGPGFQIGLRLPEPGGKSIDLYEWPALKQRSRLDMTDEELRILHVALTRARRRLVLSGIADLDEPPRQTEANSTATRLTQGYDVAEPIAVPAPPALDALAAPGPSVIEIHLNRPERAAELAGEIELEASTEVADRDGDPPLWRPKDAGWPEVPLSYSALASFRECPARFYASRILKLEGPDRERERLPLDPEEDLGEPIDATAFGTAVHRLLERMPARDWRPPSEGEIDSTLTAERVDSAGARAEARAMIDAFLGSELAREVRKGRPEVETSLLVDVDGVMIRGFADLLVRDLERPLILDYKSNRIEGTSVAALMERYDLQSDLYALAVSRALAAETVETAFVFLRDPASPARRVYSAPDLEAAGRRISAMVADIAAGRYLGGPEASHQPCGACWACATLGVQKGTSGSAGGASASG
ncbi:MAG: UvrD-helicase domain-containing protein [Solirubrobacterales bacterium]|nr:UvrD-helicase domain-containing protein [Solirubrobacterales bacterium]